MRFVLPLWVILLVPPDAAALELGLPLRCEPGRSCWMPRYVDLDPGPGFKDYRCGTRLGEDGHSGIDFAIPSLAAMRAGVPVLAAAAGRVRNTRDGMEDVSVAVIGRAAIEGRNCGNGVVIQHGDGWETQYCHLRQGSVAVQPGHQVEKGQELGLVGMSGEASFPHVHLSVRRGEEQVDPFRGIDGGPACGPGDAPLWQPELLAELVYLPVMLTHAGFAPGPPEWEQVQNGDFDRTVMPLDAPALVLWLEAFEIGAGDRLSWRIAGPDGTVLFENATVEAKAQRQAFRFAGQRRPAEGWAPGVYAGTIRIERAGAPLQEQRVEVELR